MDIRLIRKVIQDELKAVKAGDKARARRVLIQAGIMSKKGLLKGIFKKLPDL